MKKIRKLIVPILTIASFGSMAGINAVNIRRSLQVVDNNVNEVENLEEVSPNLETATSRTTKTTQFYYDLPKASEFDTTYASKGTTANGETTYSSLITCVKKDSAYTYTENEVRSKELYDLLVSKKGTHEGFFAYLNYFSNSTEGFMPYWTGGQGGSPYSLLDNKTFEIKESLNACCYLIPVDCLISYDTFLETAIKTNVLKIFTNNSSFTSVSVGLSFVFTDRNYKRFSDFESTDTLFTLSPSTPFYSLSYNTDEITNFYNNIVDISKKAYIKEIAVKYFYTDSTDSTNVVDFTTNFGNYYTNYLATLEDKGFVDFLDYSKFDSLTDFESLYSSLIYTVSQYVSTDTTKTWNVSAKYSILYSKDSLDEKKTKDLYYYIPSVPTLDNILESVDSTELFGSKVTMEITNVERLKYTGKLGVQSVNVTSTVESIGQTATGTLNIHILDITAPTVYLKSNKKLIFSADSGEGIKMNELADYFNIADSGTEYGGSILNPTYMLDGKNLTSDRLFSSADAGLHTLKITVSDSSGNVTTKSFSVTVTDSTAPVISRKDNSDMSTLIKLGYGSKFTEKDFLNLFTATDNVDENIDSKICISGKFDVATLGKHKVIISVTDSSGNESTNDVEIDTVSDLPKVGLVSENHAITTSDVNLNLSDLTAIVTKGIYADKEIPSCYVDGSDYLKRSEETGDFNINYTATVDGVNVGGSYILTVKDGDKEEETENGFILFCQRIGNGFRGIFTKWKFDCWITNKEWNERFGIVE